MNHKREVKKGFTTFIKAQELGKCPCCDKNVYNDQLFVENNKETYHYSCYNEKVDKDK